MNNNIAGAEFSNGQMHLKNGEMKIKLTFMAIFAFTILTIFLIFGVYLLINGIINLEIESIIMPLILIGAILYGFKVSFYTQSSKNFYIEFPNENSCIGFKLYYKGSQIVIPYKVDQFGKIILDNYESENKINSIHYIDGTSIKSATQRTITYYFVRWLHLNNLMSDDPSGTFKNRFK